MSDPNRPRRPPSGSHPGPQDDDPKRSRRDSRSASRSPREPARSPLGDDDGERVGAPRTRLPSRDNNGAPPARNGRDGRDGGPRTRSRDSERDSERDGDRDGDRYGRRGDGRHDSPTRSPDASRRRSGSSDGWEDGGWDDAPAAERRPRGGSQTHAPRESYDGWDEAPERSARRHGSSAGANRDGRERRGDGRDGPSGWNDRAWNEKGSDDGWDDGAWNESDWGGGLGAGGRHGSMARGEEDVWRPASELGPVGNGRRGMAARAGAAWKSATSSVASAVKRPSSLRARLMLRLRTDKRARIVAIVLLVIVLIGLIPTPVLAYSNTMSTAKDGIAHLKNAEADFKLLATSPTNLTLINNAQSELQASHNDFAALQWRVALLGPVSALPKIGGKVSGVTKLVPLAVDGTQAGVLACDALKTLVTGLHDPLGTSGGLSSAQAAQIASDLDQVHALYGQMEPILASLTQSDLALDPGLWPTIQSLQARLPQVTQMMNDLDGMGHVLPQLLGVGKPATYLVLVLDSSELRPTGGFIGNFGALTVDGGRLDPGFHVSDITLIDSSVKFPQGYGVGDVPYVQQLHFPPQYDWLKSVFKYPDSASWSLRDSNLDPNYPTTAQYALSLYPQLLPDAQKNLSALGSSLPLYDPAKSGPFAGVVTLSLGFFAQALNITGPLHIVDHSINDTVNAQNFVDKIHYYSLSTNHNTGYDSQVCGTTSCAKVFTSDVVKAFMAQVKANLSSYLGKLAKLAYDSLRTKDIEIYLTAQPAQQLLQDLNVASTVIAPKTGDTVFEVDANIGANKDNYFLKYQMSDQVNISQSGDVTHKLAWNYRWPANLTDPSVVFAAGSPNYHSYSRVYVPGNASLISQSGLQEFGTDNVSATTFGLKVFHGDAYAYFPGYGGYGPYNYGVSWKVPGVVTHDSTGYHYDLLFQREAGVVWPLTVTITLPTCAKLVSAPGITGVTSANSATIKGNVVTITGPLTENEQYVLNWTC